MVSLQSFSDGLKPKKKPKVSSNPKQYRLFVNPNKKKGILSTGFLESCRVTLVHISGNGDALVSADKTVLMVSAANVVLVSDNEAVEGPKRLEYVRSIYRGVMNGEIIDRCSVYLEMLKWLL